MLRASSIDGKLAVLSWAAGCGNHCGMSRRNFCRRLAPIGRCVTILAVTACARGIVRAPPALPADITDVDIEYFTEHPLMVPVDGVPPGQITDSFHAPRGD